MKSIPLTGANRVPIPVHQPRKSIFGRLVFPADLRHAMSKGKNPISQVSQARSKHIDTSLSLKSGAAPGQRTAANNLIEALASGICSRYLRDMLGTRANLPSDTLHA